MNRIEDWIDKLVSLAMWLAIFVGFLMMAHITLDVTGRLLFNHPLTGTIEVASRYYMVAVAFMPLAHVSRGDGQIIVELFTRNLAPERILRIDAVINIITMIFMFIFAWYTTDIAIEMTHEGRAVGCCPSVSGSWRSISRFAACKIIKNPPRPRVGKKTCHL